MNGRCSRFHLAPAFVALVATGLLGGTALGQSEPRQLRPQERPLPDSFAPDAPRQPRQSRPLPEGETFAQQSRINFSWTTGVEFQDSTDVEGGGDVSVVRASTSLGMRIDYSPELNLSLSFAFGIDQYDFDGTTGFAGANPWDDIYTISTGAIFRLHLTNDWTLFGGPIAQISRERSMDHSDAWTGGGMIGAEYAIEPDIRVGAGVGVITQIDDDPRLFPVVVVNWEFTNRLKLANASNRPGGTPGLELIYDAGEGIELALGGGYEFRRFRLDDADIAPDGVGEESRGLGWARVSYRPGPRVKLDLYGGFIFGGEYRLEDDEGHKVLENDIDSGSAFVALNVAIVF